MANSKLVSTKYLLRLRSQEEWEGWHFRAKAHFRKSGAWRLISEGHPRDTGKRIQVELPDYRERVLVQHRNLRRIFAGQPDRVAELIPRLPSLPRWRPETDAEFEDRCEAADRVNADLYSDLCQACFDDAESELRGIPEGDGIRAYKALLERFDKRTVNTMVARIKVLLHFKQKPNTGIEAHVTQWKNLVRRLRECREDNALVSEPVEVAIFLSTLSPKYAS